MGIISHEEFVRRAEELEWILCDVDGVLTDGGLIYGKRGQVDLRFDVRDGLGLQLAKTAGLKVGVLSGRSSTALDRRATELKLDEVMTGVRDKGAEFESFLSRNTTVARRVAFIGDDLPDLVLLARCGLSFAPPDAAAEVRAVVHRVLEKPGGHGVVREMIESILRARSDWDRVFSPFTLDA
jgi:3-deoxy-D-manno-octulosonate 8-phosphate phosphatase (KDO 8-P phosphatase)